MADTLTHVQRTERFDLNALYETSRLLSASLDLGFVLNNLLLTAMSKLFVTRGAAMIYDAVTGAHRVASVKGVAVWHAGDLMQIGSIPPDRMLEGADVPPILAEQRIALVIPVCFAHREIGLLALGSKATRQPFERQELTFIQSLVNMSAAAVHNSIMVEELRQANRDLDGRIQQLDTLFELSQAFNATRDREQHARLLSFALMAHTLVGKFLLIMRPVGGPARVGEPYVVVTSRGLVRPDPGPALAERMFGLEQMVLADEAAEWEDVRALGLVLLVPLRQNGETCAVLCLGPKMSGQPYQPADLEFVYSLGNLAFVSLRNADLIGQQIEKERLEEELRLAREIQERLLPQELPRLTSLDLAAVAMPSRHVGGDYYDVASLDGSRVLVAIADVTGKGMPAALLMSNVQACLQIVLPLDMTLEDATAHMNRVICSNTGYDKFITYFHGIFHCESGEFHYVNAGHNPPILLRADGQMELLEEGGLLLGVVNGVTYTRGVIALRPGDVLACFTDGVTEAMSTAEEDYGDDRLQAVLAASRHLPAQGILDAVLNDIRAFTGEAFLQSDDLTMIVCKVPEGSDCASGEDAAG